MKIKSISARDNKTGWNVNNIQFNHMLTLLVGASGVGKTKILNIVKTLTNIVNGESVEGFAWKIEFENGGKNFIWEGEFEQKKEQPQSILKDLEAKESGVPIIKEAITDNKGVIINRSGNKIVYKNKELVRLDNTKSVLELLKEEPLIRPIHNCFQQCYDLDTAENSLHISPIVDISKRPLNVNLIKALKFFSPLERLFLLHEKRLKEFDVICQRFIEIFPSVESVDFTLAKGIKGLIFPILRIKEKNVSTWIEQMEISSGMFRTLIQITTLVLASEGDVILIDEFENGLGVNCINELADLIMDPETDIQVIMTSHHPYIINAIPVNDWKILTRNGCDVHVHTAEQLNIGEHSKHEAFMQLLQTPEYKTGQNRN